MVGGTRHCRAWPRILTSCRAQYLLTRDMMPQTSPPRAQISPPNLGNISMARWSWTKSSATLNIAQDRSVACTAPRFCPSSSCLEVPAVKVAAVPYPRTAVAMTSTIFCQCPLATPNLGRLPQSRRPSAAGRSSKDSTPAARGALGGWHSRGAWPVRNGGGPTPSKQKGKRLSGGDGEMRLGLGELANLQRVDPPESTGQG